TVDEHFVAGGADSAEIIIIHAEKIIMDERVGVYAFQREGERKCVINATATSFGCGETKNRSQSFAAGEQTVTHRLVERGRLRTRFRQIAVQRAIDFSLPRPKIVF